MYSAKTILWAGLFAALSVTSETKAQSGSDSEPVYWNGDGAETIMNVSNKPMEIVAGQNALNKAHSFTCNSMKGCFVIAAISETVSFPAGSQNYSTCTYIDGQSSGFSPTCDTDYPNFFGAVLKHQGAKVAPGRHSIQSFLKADEDGGTAYSWEVDYSIYERGDKP